MPTDNVPTANVPAEDGGRDVALMTEEQAVRLRALSQRALEPEAFKQHLTSAEATLRIAALEAKLRLQDGPPHTL